MRLNKMMQCASALASIRRYSQIHHVRSESLLEHLGFVTLLCYFIALEINAQCKSAVIDVALLLRRAIVHDLEEITIGDVPRPTKHANPEMIKLFHELEKDGIARILSELGYPKLGDVHTQLSFAVRVEVMDDWTHAKSGHEGCIVAVADIVAVVYKTWEEVAVKGNRAMLMYGREIPNYVESMRDKVQTTFANSGDSRIAREVLLDVLDEAKAVADKSLSGIDDDSVFVVNTR